MCKGCTCGDNCKTRTDIDKEKMAITYSELKLEQEEDFSSLQEKVKEKSNG